MHGGWFQVLCSARRAGERQAKASFHIEDVSGSLSRADFDAVPDRSTSIRLSEMLLARRFFISGVVQGVGYRFFAQRSAIRLGVAGYAKNLRDGRVEVLAVATEQVMDDYHTELRRGPASARVSQVEVEKADVDAQFSVEFSIEYSD
jgi:acylphosphatase